MQNTQHYHSRGLHAEIEVDDGVWITLDRYLPQQDTSLSRQRSLSMSESASEGSDDEEQSQQKQRSQQEKPMPVKDVPEDGKESKSVEGSPDHEEEDGSQEGLVKVVSTAEEEDEEWLINKSKRNDGPVSSSLPTYPSMLQ